jgi:putative cell wall-binding protein
MLIDSKGDLSNINKFKQESNLSKSYIIGGTAVVSNQTESKLLNPTRIYGQNRNETNAEVIKKLYTGSSYNNAYVVKDGSKSMNQLIDGVAVGPLAAATKSPVVLVNTTNLDASQKTTLKEKTFNAVVQIGAGGNENAYQELLRLKLNF